MCRRRNKPRSIVISPPVMERYSNDIRRAQAQWRSPSASSSTLDCDPGAEKEEVPANDNNDNMQDPEIGRPNMSQRSSSMKPCSSQSDIVDFDGPDDRENPKNWSRRRKWAVTGGMGGMTFVVTFASSVFVSIYFFQSHLIQTDHCLAG